MLNNRTYVHISVNVCNISNSHVIFKHDSSNFNYNKTVPLIFKAKAACILYTILYNLYIYEHLLDKIHREHKEMEWTDGQSIFAPKRLSLNNHTFLRLFFWGQSSQNGRVPSVQRKLGGSLIPRWQSKNDPRSLANLTLFGFNKKNSFAKSGNPIIYSHYASIRVI